MSGSLRFEFEWLDPGAARGTELRATWARLAVTVEGHTVTRLFDDRSHTVRDAVYVPLYPLVEWFVRHWWSLCYEVQNDRDDEPYLNRHALAKSREGYAFPPLVFESQLSQVRISWAHERLATRRAEFISDGHAHVPLDEFKASVAGLVEAVNRRLDDSGVSGTFLQDEWPVIRDADPEESAFCAAAAALGEDPYNLDRTLGDAIVRVGERLPAELHREFFAATASGSLDASEAQLTSALDLIRRNRSEAGVLPELRLRLLERIRDSLYTGVAPWQQGYRAASAVRAELGLNGDPLATLGEVGRRLGLRSHEVDEIVLTTDLPVDAVAGVNARGKPVFAVRADRPETARRFHFCRSLLEFLAGREGATTLVTRSSSHAQKVNRAFAAELLAPSDGIRSRLSGRIIDPDRVSEIADEFGVPEIVVLHQIENHGLARVASAW